MPVYKEIYDAQKDNAKLELKKEIKESLISRGYSEGDFEIVKKDTKYVIEFSDDVEKKETFSDYQKEKVAAAKKELLKEGVDKEYIAEGLAGVSTPESMVLRERLLREGAGKDYIAYSLAGVSTKESMVLRERLLKEGANKSYTAQGLAGVSTPESMELRERLEKEGVNPELIYRHYFCNSQKLVFMTKIFEHNQSQDETGEFEEERLEKLNLIDGSDKEKEEEFLRGFEESDAERLMKNERFAKNINKLIAEDPAIFFGDIRAKDGKLNSWQTQVLVYKLFPEIKTNKEAKERNRKSNSFLRSIFGGQGGGNRDAGGQENGTDIFGDSQQTELFGGDPSREGVNEVLMEFREDTQGMLATRFCFEGERNSSRWGQIQIPLSSELVGPTEEVTGQIYTKGLNTAVLPRFFDAQVIGERVKALNKKGDEVEFETEVSPLQQVIIKSDKPIETIIYSQERQVVPEIPNNISDEEYDEFKTELENKYGTKISEKVLDLPSELRVFIDSIKGLSPREKIIEIEEMVKKISFYDMDNKDVMDIKRGKSNDERLSIMQMRMDELRDQGKDVQGKMYAGVCADFSLLLTAMLREAGFVSGVSVGINVSGKKANSLDAHSTSTILWPGENGEYKLFSLDGTPNSQDEGEQSFIDSIRGMSMKEKMKEYEEKKEMVIKDAEEKLKEIEDILNENDIEKIKKLSNGELERMLNAILRYKVKENHLHIINTVLNAGRYSGVSMEDQVSAMRFIEKEIERERKKGEQKTTASDAGKEFFSSMRSFIDQYGGKDDKEEAIEKIEKVLSISEKYLSDIEKKAAFATINYLKAKNLV